MPTRIYAFAKELGLDNKALLDICEKASIKGKGSALASLDDTEISQVKAFMAGGSDTAAEAPVEADTGAPVRPRSTTTKKKIGEITAPVREVKDELESEPEEQTADVEVVAEVETVEEPTAPVEAPPTETVEASAEAEQPAAKSPLLSRLKGDTNEAAEEDVAKPAKPKVTPAKPTPASKATVSPSPLTNRRGMSPRRPGVAPRRQPRNLDQSSKSV